MLAAALNELAAGEESKMKRGVGDPANLRTKLNILLSPAPRGLRRQRDAPQSFKYDETKTFKGFTR